MDYQKLVHFLKLKFSEFITIKEKYIIFSIPKANTNTNANSNADHHITIFKDQWDDYASITRKPYHLFHISSNNTDNRCSSYFWVGLNTLKIQKIPRGQFLYNQPTYNFYASTRQPCQLKEIMYLLISFQKILNSAKKMAI